MSNINETRPGRALRVAQVIRDGGGTAPVELTVAAKLRDRGHRVELYGPPEVAGHAREAGFAPRVLDWPAELGPRTAEDLVPRMIGASVSWARQLAPRLAGEAVDVVVADCAVFGALMAARLAGVPSAALMPTVYVAGPARRRDSPPGDGPRGDSPPGDWAPALAGINRARAALGLAPVGSVTEQVVDADRLLLLTSRAFELPDVEPPAHARYVGPQLPAPGPAAPYRLPAGDQPLVLVSLSTTDQGQLDLLERLLAALAGLPVRALVTVGPAVDPGRLAPAANTVVARFVPHRLVLPHASLVVTHAGHGTVMAALSAGVPLVCVPMGRDQPAVAARVAHHGLGISVDPHAGTAELRAAVQRVLGDPTYRDATRRMAALVEPSGRAVEEVEALAAAHHR